MSLKEELFIPKSPVSIPIRPINKGMIRHLPSSGLPPGAVLTAKNLIVGTSGPLRRPGLLHYAGNGTTPFYFSPIRGIVVLTKTDGTQQTILFDNRLIYVITATGFTAYTWDYDTQTINCAAGSLTVSGLNNTNWTGTNADLQSGDIFVAGTATAGNLERIEITSLDATNLLTLKEVTSYAHTQTNYDIHRAFGASNPYMVNWASVDNKVVFSDSSRPPYSFDGTTFGDYDSSLTFIPACVEYFKDRLWFGHIQIGATDHRQRIIWSKVTDHTDFEPTTRYLDLDYQEGACQRLKGLGNLLVAYFDDAIYYGRQTNIAGDTLPYAFEKLETGGVGLLGMNALTPYLDGHFFVGQDDIYFLSNKGFERIGTPIVSETIGQCEEGWAVYAALDPARNRVVFGFPTDGHEMVKLWSFDYKAKAWSYDKITCTCIAGNLATESVTWDGSAGTWDTLEYPSWDSTKTSAKNKFYVNFDPGFIHTLSSDAATDAGDVSIPIELETGDFDDNVPDGHKTTTRLSIKIDRTLSSDLVLNISYSLDHGTTWFGPQVGTIAAGNDECFVNFLATGSTIRFKITSDSTVSPYRITELVRRTRGRGLEVHLGPSD